MDDADGHKEELYVGCIRCYYVHAVLLQSDSASVQPYLVELRVPAQAIRLRVVKHAATHHTIIFDISKGLQLPNC